MPKRLLFFVGCLFSRRAIQAQEPMAQECFLEGLAEGEDGRPRVRQRQVPQDSRLFQGMRTGRENQPVAPTLVGCEPIADDLRCSQAK